MRLFALLLGLLLPGCSGDGAEGLPVPPPLDFAASIGASINSSLSPAVRRA